MSSSFRIAMLAGALQLSAFAHAASPSSVITPADITAAPPLDAGTTTGERGPDLANPDEESEDIVVQATRSGRRVQDEAIRVEVIDREEIEEKILMSPGNIATLMAETGGLRVQIASPALGAANVRIRGLEGRYTLLLSDGLPLYGQASSVGLLQIPPTDLGRVEVIKGAASALYGASALGGVINLVSRRPGNVTEAELLLNTTTRGGQDATGYLATPIGDDWSASITSGLHRQSRKDLDDDGWSDIPAFDRLTVRPRIFWDGADGETMLATFGATIEDRRGGTTPGKVVPDGRPFAQQQNSTRLDAGLVASFAVGRLGTARVRVSGMTQDHRHIFGDVPERDRHSTLFGEASIAAAAGGTNWAFGMAFQLDDYRSRTFPAFDYRYVAPGLFGQVERDLTESLTIAGSARIDFHSDYDARLSPRVSLLFRPDRWTVRASIGRGFYAPTPFVDETEDAGLSRLEPLRDLRAEVADTASLDIGYAQGGTELNASFFASRVRDALRLEPSGPVSARLVSIEGEVRTHGLELLVRQRWDAFTLTGSYVRVNASEPGATGNNRRPVERTPQDTAGLVAIWENPGRGRIGIEAYYTGKQRLENNPYRDQSPRYLELGMLGEVALGRARLFLNAENILGVRQTRNDPLLRPSRTADGRWTVDIWGPTEGFVLNGGFRMSFTG